MTQNAAASVRAPTASHVRREGQLLTHVELEGLATACRGIYADVVLVLGLSGLRWGELAGLQVGDRIAVPGRACGSNDPFWQVASAESSSSTP